MKVSKLEELLNCLKDKDIDVILDTSRIYDEIKHNNIYDLIVLSIENKDDKTVVKLGFEEREVKNKKCENRIRSMDFNIHNIGDNNE